MSKNDKIQEQVKIDFVTEFGNKDEKKKQIKLNQFGELPYHLDPVINRLKAIGGILNSLWILFVCYIFYWLFMM